MKLSDLLAVIDHDTRIFIQYKFAELHHGKRIDYTPVPEVADKEVKSVWYSPIYTAIMIEV